MNSLPPNSHYIGVDVGSISVKTILCNSSMSIIREQYYRHHGKSLEVCRQSIEELVQKFPDADIAGIAFTGNGAQLAARVLNAWYVNEVIAQSRSTAFLYPQVNTIIEIGGEDAKLIKLDEEKEGSPRRLKDFSMNTVCAAGTGSFLDQQAHRLNISIEEEFGALAVTAKEIPRIAGRCSVFAKSDMIHLQQTATPVAGILMGLCMAMAKNFKGNVAKGMELNPVIAFQGGVAANAGMVKAFEKVLRLSEGQLFIPKHFKSMGALGAVIAMVEQKIHSPFTGTQPLKDHLQKPPERKKAHPPLGKSDYHIMTDPLPLRGREPVDVYLGVDVGSISTNLVLMDNDKRVVARRYVMTGGNPLEAVKNALADMGKEMGSRVVVRAVATTGSGRYLTGDFIGADLVKNEITAHARGAVSVCPEVDTIFEIGGQDSKYISLREGVVTDYTMNKVCAAGTGSFLQEQAEKLNVNIKGEFSRLALSSQAPAMLGERCTVFMESSLNKQQQSGAEKEDLLAGLAYSIVRNYISTVVEKRKIGDVILFQGGTAYNEAVKTAFERVCGKKIIIPPHHDVLGALGCAVIAMENRPEGSSAFKGFDLTQKALKFDSFICNDCSNSCEIRTVSVEGEAPLTYGSRCDKFETQKKKKVLHNIPDLFAEREKMLMAERIPTSPLKQDAPTMGIPRSLLFYEMYPFWNAFFTCLGYRVIASPPSSRKIITQGCEAVVEEVCYPVKLSMGHTLELLERKPDYLFLPCIVNADKIHEHACGSSVCPLVQSFPYLSDAALEFEKYPVKVLRPDFHFGNRDIEKELFRFGRRLGHASNQVKQSVREAFQAQNSFREALVKRGQQVLSALPAHMPSMVIVSRPYNGSDRGLNIGLPSKLKELGVLAIPVDFLPIEAPASDHIKNMYWRYGQRILSAAHYIADTPGLHALYLSNFACGPDSFIIKYFHEIMNGKQMLALEVDEHSADAGVVTRLEAFLDSLTSSAAYQDTPAPKSIGSGARKEFFTNRKLFVPYIDDQCRGVAAAARFYGIDAEALPASDERSLEIAKEYTSGKECYPFLITTGDILKKALEKDFVPEESSFIMPTTNGPCRFGQYCHSHQMVLDNAGLGAAKMVTVDQASDFGSDLQKLGAGFRKLMWQMIIATDNMKKLLLKTRPYEAVAGISDKVYEDCLQYMERTLERDGTTGDTVKHAVNKFSQIPLKNGVRKPLIGIIGEIYVRSNDFSNNYIVKQIEQLGGEVALPTFHEWVLYCDWERKIDFRRKGDYINYMRELIESAVQKYYTRKETRPAQGFIERFLYEMPVNELIKLSHPYITENLRGEATLSMGRAEEYALHGFQGVVNLTPFHCMPGTITNTLLVQFAKKYPGVPVLKMVYDGTEQSGERARLEAFMFQTKQLVEE